MVQVLVAVPAYRRVTAEHDVGLDAPDHARQVATQADGRLDDTVLIAQEDDVLHAEDLRGVPGLALADRDQPRVVRRVLVGAGAARRDQAEHDVAPLTRPAGDTPRDRELVVLRVRGAAEAPRA